VAVAQGLAAADAVVAPTRWMADEITRHYGAPQRSRVIANGSEVVRFAPAAKAPVVFAAGRFWDEGKNLRALDAAAAMLGAEVRVAGDLTGTDGRSVAPVHATALGHLSPDAIAAELAQAAVYALPARYEPFGLSVLEAAASGCALVLGDIPSLHETWGDAALYVPPDDPGALAVTIADLLADEARRSALAAAALRRSRDLTAARMASRYCALYRELAGAQAAIAATG
jgi:glycosyltransferase involved in cell wall biosynthesis